MTLKGENMCNKAKVKYLLGQLQTCFNQGYVWREIGDREALEEVSNRIKEIRQEILDIVID